MSIGIDGRAKPGMPAGALLTRDAQLGAAWVESADAGQGLVSAGIGHPPIYRNPGWVDVRDYGATGDGLTDDTLAIQTAITAVGNAGVVFVPAGKYVVSAPILVPSNVTLQGVAATLPDARSSLLYLKAGSHCDVIRNAAYPTTNAGITLSRLSIDGNHAGNSAGAGINLKLTNWVSLDEVWVQGAVQDDLLLDTCNAVHVNNCRTAGAGAAGLHAIGGSAHTYTNLNSELNATHGVHISGTDAASAYAIVSPYTESCANGIYVDGRGVTLIGGRGSQHSAADLCFTDNAHTYDNTAIGFVAASAAPSVGNIVIGAAALQITLLGCSCATLVNNAAAGTVLIYGPDASGEYSAVDLHLRGKTLGSAAGIRDLGAAGLTFAANANHFLSLLAGVLTLSANGALRLASKTSSVQVYPKDGASDGIVDTTGDVRINGRVDYRNSQATVGAAGAASALPAQPTGYTLVKISGTEYVMPYYLKA